MNEISKKIEQLSIFANSKFEDAKMYIANHPKYFLLAFGVLGLILFIVTIFVTIEDFKLRKLRAGNLKLHRGYFKIITRLISIILWFIIAVTGILSFILY